MIEAIVYTDPNDKASLDIKALLKRSKVDFTEGVIGADMIKEDIDLLWPNRTGSVVVIGGNILYNITQLTEWLSSRPRLLTE